MKQLNGYTERKGMGGAEQQHTPAAARSIHAAPAQQFSA